MIPRQVGGPAPGHKYKAIARDIAYHGTTFGALVHQRRRVSPHAVRAARPRGAAREQHEPLPPPARGDGGGVHGLPPRRARADDPGDGARDGLPRPHGADPERRRLVHRARGLLEGRARALRPLRHPALGRRGDHRLRARRPLVRVRALRHQARHRHVREGALVVVRGDRRRRRHRPGDGAVPRRRPRCTRTGSRSAAIP